MYGILAGLVSPLTSRTTWLRWAHLIMGGALLMPYIILGSLLTNWGTGQATDLFVPSAFAVVLPLSLPVVALTALLIPAIRMVEGTAVKELVGGPGASLTVEKAGSWQSRWRSAAWFVLHLALGGVISALTLSMPPLAAVLMAEPFVDLPALVPRTWDTALAPVAGLAVVVGLVYLVAAVGAVLARLSPVLLGPSPSERLAELERQAGQLAERNRLARELHDSVGHALTSTTLQASAASRVLDADPDFARRALAAIEETGRAALEDLDHVLGLLRDGASDRAPQRTLTDLEDLFVNMRAAGITIDAELTGDIDKAPSAVSREAYRIVQEGLTNVLRHAGKVPVALRLAIQPDRLELDMTNPTGSGRSDDGNRRGGSGLDGMRERVAILRGQMSAEPDGDQWRVSVRLPMDTRS